MKYDTAIFYNTQRKEIFLYNPLEGLNDLNKKININKIYRLDSKFLKLAATLYGLYTNHSQNHPLNKPIGEFAENPIYTPVPKEVYKIITGLDLHQEEKNTKEKNNKNELEQILNLEVA